LGSYSGISTAVLDIVRGWVGLDEATDHRQTSVRLGGAVHTLCGSTAITTRSLGSAQVAADVPPVLDEHE
jgi:hypothetical protein